MSLLQDAFAPLLCHFPMPPPYQLCHLPIGLEDDSYLPTDHYFTGHIDSSFPQSPDELDFTFGNNFLLDRDAPLPDPTPVVTQEESNDILSPLSFYIGRQRGQQCSYNGYIYVLNKSRPNGHRYWECRERRRHKPPCKGRLITLGSTTVTKEGPHSHPASLEDVRVESFLSQIRTDNGNEKAASVVKKKLLGVSPCVRSTLPTDVNLKKLIRKFRRNSSETLPFGASCFHC